MTDSGIKNEVLIVTNGFDHQAGGLEQAALNRAKAFAQHGINTCILTFNDDIKALESLDRLSRLSRTSEKMLWLNVYEYYRQKYTSPKIALGVKIKQFFNRKLFHNLTIIKLTRRPRQKHGKLRVDYRKQQIVRKKKIFYPDGSLSHITHFNELRKPIYREVYGRARYVKRSTMLDPKTRKIISESRYTPDGFRYLLRTKIKEDWRYELCDRAGDRTIYKSTEEFRTAWLNEIADQRQIKPILIFDQLDMAMAGLSMDTSLAHRIFVLHGNHYDDTGPKAIKLRQRIVRNLKDIEQLVVLTERQKEDIIREFGDFNNVAVIPNSARPTTIKRTPKKDLKQIALIARFVPTKQVDHAIKAFSRVTADVPDARLNIYGKGEGLAEAEELVQKLKLKDNVRFMGFVQAEDLDEAYATSLACIMTSKYEALPLSILESMLNETPFVCYDLKYGPSDVIVDGETGYIVPAGNIDAMANKLVWLLNNPQEAIKAGKRAKHEIRRKYSEEVILKSWQKLLTKISAADH